MYSSPDVPARGAPRRRQPSAASASRRRASGDVAAGPRDQALDPRHPRHERPRLVARPDRLQRGAAQLGRGRVGVAGRRPAPRPAASRAAGPAHRRVAVQRGAEQVGRLAVAARRRARPARRRGGPRRASAASRAARPWPAARRRSSAASSWRPSRDSRWARAARQGSAITGHAAGRRDPAVGGAQRAVEVARAGQRARRLDPDDVGEVGPPHAVERGPGALRHAPRTRRTGRAGSRRSAARSRSPPTVVVVGLGDQRRGLGQQRAAAGRVAGRRLVPGEADQHLRPAARPARPGRAAPRPGGRRRARRPGCTRRS